MGHRHFSALATSAAIVLAAPFAHAGETVPALPPAAAVAETATPPSSEPELESRWCGWQILIVDGASVATMPILVGIGGDFLGRPIVGVAGTF